MRKGLIAVLLAAVAILLAWALTAGVILLVNPLREAARDALTRQAVERQAARYLQAVMRGDLSGALAVWETDVQPPERAALLTERRAALTAELIALDIRGYNVMDIQWWTTCCEPGVTCSARNAGGARVMVSLQPHQRENVFLFMFDVFTRVQPYWGDAAGNPLRRWVLRDVYRWGEQPIFWPLVSETSTRQWAPPAE